MASSTILRIPRAGHPPLIVSVRPKGSGNLKNLKIVALDREEQHLYHGSVKASNAETLLVSRDDRDSTNWMEILSYVLLHESSEDPVPEYLQELEIIADIVGQTSAITVRRNIGGITQKLGAVPLTQDDEREEIDVVEWADLAVSSSDELRQRVQELETTIHSQRSQITQLSSKLDELVKAKKEHEDELLGKFAALLNEKKLKIRDQQRLLSVANIQGGIADEITGARRREQPCQTKSSRSGKRKADADDEITLEDPGNGEGALSLDDDESEDEDAFLARATPEETDTESGGEADADEAAATAPAQSQANDNASRGRVVPRLEPQPTSPPFPDRRNDANPSGSDDETDDEL